MSTHMIAQQNAPSTKHNSKWCHRSTQYHRCSWLTQVDGVIQNQTNHPSSLPIARVANFQSVMAILQSGRRSLDWPTVKLQQCTMAHKVAFMVKSRTFKSKIKQCREMITLTQQGSSKLISPITQSSLHPNKSLISWKQTFTSFITPRNQESHRSKSRLTLGN